jgi:hypothetical protein
MTGDDAEFVRVEGVVVEGDDAEFVRVEGVVVEGDDAELSSSRVHPARARPTPLH